LSKKYSIDLNDRNSIDQKVIDQVKKLEEQARKFYDEFELQSAVQTIHEIASFGNEYITKIQPWQKDIPEDERLSCLTTLGFILSIIIELYSPIIPESTSRASEMLENNEVGVLFEKLN
jgi:methionyl-tRNA synthetase